MFLHEVKPMKNLYQVKGRIEMLKQRANRCVCKYCGEKLSLRRIIFSDVEDARVELYCNKCERIEFGIEPEIYTSACDFVDNIEFDYYESMDNNPQKRQMNVAKVCEILAWGCKDMGILNQEGFQVPLNGKMGLWSECLIMSSEKIDESEILLLEMGDD